MKKSLFACSSLLSLTLLLGAESLLASGVAVTHCPESAMKAHSEAAKKISQDSKIYQNDFQVIWCGFYAFQFSQDANDEGFKQAFGGLDRLLKSTMDGYSSSFSELHPHIRSNLWNFANRMLIADSSGEFDVYRRSQSYQLPFINDMLQSTENLIHYMRWQVREDSNGTRSLVPIQQNVLKPVVMGIYRLVQNAIHTKMQYGNKAFRNALSELEASAKFILNTKTADTSEDSNYLYEQLFVAYLKHEAVFDLVREGILEHMESKYSKEIQEEIAKNQQSSTDAASDTQEVDAFTASISNAAQQEAIDPKAIAESYAQHSKTYSFVVSLQRSVERAINRKGYTREEVLKIMKSRKDLNNIKVNISDVKSNIKFDDLLPGVNP